MPCVRTSALESATLEAKWWNRSCVEHYEPDGRKPDGHCDGNDDPDEHSQPSTHAFGLGTDQVMDRNCNGENHYCSSDYQKGHSAESLPHAPA